MRCTTPTTDPGDLSENDRITVRYETTRGNPAAIEGTVEAIPISLSDGYSDAVVRTDTTDRRYLLWGTGDGFTVRSLRSDTPHTIGYSGQIEVRE